MVNDVEALIAEARIANPPWDDELVKGLLEDLADELEAANKRARLHCERGNGLAEELDIAYARITELTRHQGRVWDEGYISAEWNYEEVCNCAAWNMDECACGNYGNGHHRKENPYKTRRQAIEELVQMDFGGE